MIPGSHSADLSANWGRSKQNTENQS